MTLQGELPMTSPHCHVCHWHNQDKCAFALERSAAMSRLGECIGSFLRLRTIIGIMWIGTVRVEVLEMDTMSDP